MRPAKKLVLTGMMGLIVLLCGVAVLAFRIRAQKEERERHFVSVHYLAVEAFREIDGPAPKTIGELMMRSGGGLNSSLLKPFEDGLSYRAVDGGFELSEPGLRFVSLFRRDRLVASQRDWPRWMLSGDYAWKFPGQTIPPGFLESRGERE